MSRHAPLRPDPRTTTDFRVRAGSPLFPPDYRSSGILLHVSSLPSRFGIGDFGWSAFAWVDRLAEAEQSWWQVLPLGPTEKGNSPYEPLSTFAGNELFICPERLAADGLLKADELAVPAFRLDYVDYDAVAPFKHHLLERAWTSFRSGIRSDLKTACDEFCQTEAEWLEDYVLFRALKSERQGADFHDWPPELRDRDPAALDQARSDLAETLAKLRFGQFLVARQVDDLKDYAHAKGVRLFGDVPFFVSPDSADVWAHPELFLLNETRRPKFVAGVPPDYFSALGQLWGDPVYDWEAHRRTGYHWWLARIRALLSRVDLLRLDHFRGFEAAWHIPAGSATAQIGHWEPGPGADLLSAAQTALGGLPFVAEDLGLITPEVVALRDQFHLPGMRVLQFAFDGEPNNPFLPEHYTTDAIVYTGTHDNNTTRGWYESLTVDQQQIVCHYLRRTELSNSEVTWELLRLAWMSKAALAICPLQDVLNLGTEARMNVPGHPLDNWRWRATAEMLSSPALEKLKRLTEESARDPR